MNKYSKISILSSVSMLPMGILFGNLVAIYYKSSNPNNVDVIAGLAYLRQILVTAFTVVLVLFVISLITALKSYRQSTDHPDRSFAIIVFAIATLLMLGVVATNAANSAIIDSARIEKSQKTSSPQKRLD